MDGAGNERFGCRENCTCPICPPLASCKVLEEVTPPSLGFLIYKMGVVTYISVGYFEV